MEQKMIRILKATLNGDTRKIPLTARSHQELVQSICQLFSLGDCPSLGLKYRDDEGDLISLCSNQDFEEALLCCKYNMLDIQVTAPQIPRPQPSNPQGCWIEDFGTRVEDSFSKLAENKSLLSDLFTPISSFFNSLLDLSRDKKGDEGEGGRKQRPCFICDGCEAKITSGSRYHCLQCEDFDFCAACAKEKMKEHPSEHIFRELAVSRSPRPHFEHKREQEAPQPGVPPKVYHNAFCSQCDEKIAGIRWKCFECDELDLCEGCYEGHRRDAFKGHLASHGFARMEDPQKYFSFLQEKETYLEEKKRQREQETQGGEPSQQQSSTQEEEKKEIERVKEVIKEKIRVEKEKSGKRGEVVETPKEGEGAQSDEKPREPQRVTYPFEEKLNVLLSMGFEDRRRNIELLVSNKGDLQKTVDQLLA